MPSLYIAVGMLLALYIAIGFYVGVICFLYYDFCRPASSPSSIWSVIICSLIGMLWPIWLVFALILDCGQRIGWLDYP